MVTVYRFLSSAHSDEKFVCTTASKEPLKFLNYDETNKITKVKVFTWCRRYAKYDEGMDAKVMHLNTGPYCWVYKRGFYLCVVDREKAW